MNWTLKNISLHLWIATLVALPGSFFILPWLIGLFPGISPVFIGCFIFGSAFLTSVVLMDAAAKKIIFGLIKEGQAWERSGISKKAAKKYIRAVRMYESMLLWPFSVQKTKEKICGVLAEFQLNIGVDVDSFEAATMTYLKLNPADKDIASLWISKIKKTPLITADQQDVLSLLAEHHISDPALSKSMADIFIGLGRTDLSAKKIYARLNQEPGLDAHYSTAIEELMDEPEPEELGQQAAFHQPVSHQSGFHQKRPKKKSSVQWGKKFMSAISAFFSFVGKGFNLLLKGIRAGLFSLFRLYEFFKANKTMRSYLKTAVLVLVGGWLAFFMITTITHMVQTKAAEAEKQRIEAQTPKPFTIQVAAYLKKSHADRYANQLKKKEIDATVKQVGGGGKVWFVVRISKFASKKSAADYGRQLKKEKIIDDFFVANR